MNRTIRLLLLLFLIGGLTACKQETAETIPPTQPIAATQAAAALPETEPVQTQPPEERFFLTFAGDCTLGSNPTNYYAGWGFINTVGEDYEYPFRNVRTYLENDDFTIVNLEGALSESGYPRDKKHTFRGPVAYVEILTGNSVEAVTLANNHTLDYGQSGYDSTITALESAGIPYVERDASAIVTTESGLTIGLYGAVYYYLDVEDMTAEIVSLKEQGCDIVIYAPHWGAEGSYYPTQEQIDVAHAAIDAGADIVYGSHPHVLQSIEEYNGGIIYYSLGNFSFGGNICPEDLDTALLQQEVIRDAQGNVTLGELTIVPASISSITTRNNFQPTPYEEGTEEYQRVLAKLDGTWDGPNLKIN